MGNIFTIIREGINQAYKELVGNTLRSLLSLVGITIGIICIIGATSLVDSLEREVRDSFKSLGNDVLYIQKWPWSDVGDSWWDYYQRPEPSYPEYQYLDEKYQGDKEIGFYLEVGNMVVKSKRKSLDKVYFMGISDSFFDIIPKEFSEGRFFSPTEYRSASPTVVLGNQIASELFGATDPIGKKVMFRGYKAEVIGVIEKSGDGLVNVMNFDEIVLISIPFASNFVSIGSTSSTGGTILVKAGSQSEIEATVDELTGVMRAKRRLQPKEDESFSINRLSLLDAVFDSFFGVLNAAGFVIGIFSILVGMFSVANIMFVSVKERTNLIGVKKALGARNSFILTEFLIESIVLCLIGGVVGLLIVLAMAEILSLFFPFNLYLSAQNAFIGVGLSFVIGVLAGFIPANQAANLDPVDAMRQ